MDCPKCGCEISLATYQDGYYLAFYASCGNCDFHGDLLELSYPGEKCPTSIAIKRSIYGVYKGQVIVN